MKITGNEPAYPTGMYGQQTAPGLTIFQSFCLHAPRPTKDFLSLPNQSIYTWPPFYAASMIEQINKWEEDEDPIIRKSKLTAEILQIVSTLKIVIETKSGVHLNRAISELEKLIA